MPGVPPACAALTAARFAALIEAEVLSVCAERGCDTRVRLLACLRSGGDVSGGLARLLRASGKGSSSRCAFALRVVLLSPRGMFQEALNPRVSREISVLGFPTLESCSALFAFGLVNAKCGPPFSMLLVRTHGFSSRVPVYDRTACCGCNLKTCFMKMMALKLNYSLYNCGSRTI